MALGLLLATEGTDFNSAVIAVGLLADLWMWKSRHRKLDAYKADLCKLLNLDRGGVAENFSEAASALPLVEALCDVKRDDVTNIQLALTTLGESPQPETGSG